MTLAKQDLRKLPVFRLAAERYYQQIKDSPVYAGAVEAEVVIGVTNALMAIDRRTPLNATKLLNFDPFNFAHDMCGMTENVVFPTGSTKDFVPRCLL